MKSRPILFSAPMVRALLDGGKTQTRRVAKNPFAYRPPRCPYGQPGDWLWVRETWYCDDYRVQRGPYLLPPDTTAKAMREDGTLVYCADDSAPYEQDQPVWRPSIHMPRWASRITLEVTGVRVERLQDISEADAITEGIPTDGSACPDCHSSGWMMQGGDPVECEAPVHGRDSIDEYRLLWGQINGAGSWDADPWVWVVEFKLAKS